MNTIKRLPEAVILPLLLLAAGCFFALTSPARVPSLLLIVGFGFVFAIILSFLRLLARLTGLRGRLSSAQYKVLTWGGAAFPVLLLALQSIGQLTVRDIVTLLALFGLGCFYFVRISGRSA